MDLLWSHMEPEAGDHALRQLIWHIRNRLGEDVIRSSAGTLTLACRFECDRTTFLAGVEAQDFETAVSGYGGEFLPGFAAPGGAEFERWADLERRRLRGLFLLAAESLTRRWLAAGRFRDAIALARRARDTDRDNEAGWRLLLESLAASGDSVSAAVEAEELRRSLAEDLRVAEPATLAAIRRALNEQPQAKRDPGASLVTELVGREREFTTITSAWDAVRGGRGRHVHVEGAAGLGKTRLLNDAAARLRASGATVVEARPNPGEQDVRYAFAAALAAAIADLPGSGAVAPGSAEVLVALNPRLSTRFANTGHVGTARDRDARVFFFAMADLLDAVTDEAPLALLLDDVHWADGESRGLLAALLPRLAARRVLLVTAARPGVEGRFERPDTHHLALEPLSADQVELLLASAGSLAGAEWASGLPQALRRSTLGSPLLIVETLRLALTRSLLRLADGQWSSADPVALYELLAAGGALHQRIADLTRERRWLLTLLATAGVPVRQTILTQAVRRPETEVVADLEELSRLGLAVRAGDSWNPGHDVIAERVLEMATAEQQPAAHAALGKALLGAPDDLALLRAAARHLRAAALAGEAADVAARWIRLQRAAGDHRGAQPLVAELLGVPPGDPSARRLVRAVPLKLRIRKGRAIAAAAGVAVVIAAGALAAARATAGDVGLVIGQWRPESDGHYRLYQHSVTQQDLMSGRVTLASLRRSGVVSWDRAAGQLRPGSPGTLLTGMAFRDSGGEDLVLGTGEHFSRLTYQKGDDAFGSWSPDGRLIAFATDRWDNRSQSSIALLDPRHRDSVHRVTFGGVSRDGNPIWSPDGSRIAFMRTYLLVRRPYEMCVVAVDGAWQHCTRLPGYEFLGLAGWSSPSELVGLFRDTTGNRHLIAVDVESGATRHLAEGDVGGQSQVAGWLTCYCRRSRNEPPQLLVLSARAPDRAVRVEPAVPPGNILLFTSGRPSDYLDSLAIMNASDTIPTGEHWQLGLRAWDASGRPSEPLAVRWWSSDTLVATVDARGFVLAHSSGRATIYATAGGWRTASAEIGIRGVAPTSVITESWREGLGPAWVPFGTPRPFLTREGGVSALAPNGDSTYTSGVYARQLIPTSEGIGVEFMGSVPITLRQWQKLMVSIMAADPSTTRGWDLVRGQLPIPNEGWGGCWMTYPHYPLVEPQLLDLLNGTTRTVPLPAAATGGRWTRIRLQLFPDGRCGIAINGEPRVVLDRTLPLADSAMLLIRGNSYHTRVLVGPLEVWRGVRRDVDWSKAEGASVGRR